MPYPACALRALGLLLADGAPLWGRGRLFGALAVFLFYKIGLNSDMKESKSGSEGLKEIVSPRATNGPVTKFGPKNGGGGLTVSHKYPNVWVKIAHFRP